MSQPELERWGGKKIETSVESFYEDIVVNGRTLRVHDEVE